MEVAQLEDPGTSHLIDATTRTANAHRIKMMQKLSW
jgi:hypothetical protein